MPFARLDAAWIVASMPAILPENSVTYGRPAPRLRAQRRAVALTSLTLALCVDLALFGLAGVAVAIGRRQQATSIVYGAAVALCLIALAGALLALIGRAGPETLIVPLGLPWLGSHFRL